MIKKRNGKYVLYTKDGKRVLGTHNTAREAYAQEYAIEKSMEKKAVLGPEGTLLGAAIGRSLGSTDEEKARAAALGGAAAMGAGYAAMPYVFTPAIEALLTKGDLAEFNRGLQRPGLVNKAKTYGEAAGKIFNAGNLLKLKSPFSYVQQHKSGLDVLKGIASIYPRGLAVAGTAGLLGGLLGKYTADTEKTSSERLRTTVFGLDNEGKLLHGFSNKGYYKFPGGTVEPGEDLLESAKRELLEEAGYEVDSIEELPIASTLSSGGQRHGGADAVSRTKYLLARLGQRNATQLGADGDAISSLSTAPIPEVIDGLVGDEMFGYQVAGQNRAALEKLRDIIAGREKTSSANQPLLRHRSTLLIRDPETGRVLAAKAPKGSTASPFYFPGGGLYDDEYSAPRNPSEKDIIEGARREALEELGIAIANPRVVGSYGQEMADWWKAKTLKNRGVPYVGGHEHYVLADKGKEDRSLYNVEGDAFEQGEYYDPEEIAQALTRAGNSDSAFAPFNREQVRVIRDNLLTKTSSDQQDVYVQSAVPTKYLELMKRKGLASQKAIAKDPELLKAFLDVRNLSEEKFRADLAERLDNWQSDSVSGPSVFFTSPDPDKVSDPRHFINQFKTSPVKINLSRLIRDMPDTRIAGSELVPYDPDGPEHQGDIRHRDITLEQAAEYARTDPKELWKNYKPEYVGKYYAADVPHAMIVTPSGVIPPEYLEVEKTSSDSDFTPDLSPDQLKSLGVYDQVYGDAPSEASMKEWPESWINEQDPLGWLQWYERYSKGRRTDDDARQIKRWKSFKARHLAQYLKNPTKRRAAALRNWGVDVSELPNSVGTNKEASSPVLKLSQAIQEYEKPSTAMGHKVANISRAARIGSRALRRSRLSNRTAGNNSRLRGHTRISRRRPLPTRPSAPLGTQTRPPQRATRPMQRVEPNPDAQLSAGSPSSQLRSQSAKSIGASAGSVQMRTQAGDALSAKAIQTARDNAATIEKAVSAPLLGAAGTLSIRDLVNNPGMMPEVAQMFPRTTEVARRGAAQAALDSASRRAIDTAKGRIPGSSVYEAGQATREITNAAGTLPDRVSATTGAIRRAGQSAGRAADTVESVAGSNQVSEVARRASRRATEVADTIDNTAPAAIARVQQGAQKIVDFEQKALGAFKSHPRYTEIASGVEQLKRLAAAGDVQGVRELSNRLQRIVGAESSTRSQYLGALLGDLAESRTGVSTLGNAIQGGVGFVGDTALPFIGGAIQTSVGGGYLGPAGGLFKNFVTNPLMHQAYSRTIPGYGSAASLYRSGALGRAGAGAFEDFQRLVSSGVPVNDAIKQVQRLPGYQTLDRYIAENSRMLRDYLPGMSPLSPAAVRRQYLSGLASSLGRRRPLNAIGNPGLGAVGEAEQQILRLQGSARDAATATGIPTFTPFKTQRGIRGSVPHVTHGEMRSGEGFTYGRLMDALGGEAVAVNAPQRVYLPGGGTGYKPRPNAGRVRAARERLEALGTGDAANRRATVGEVAPILEDVGLVTPGYSSGLSQDALRTPFMNLTEPTRADIRAVNKLRQRLNNLERQGGRGMSTLLPPEFRISGKTSGYKSDLTKTSRAQLAEAIKTAKEKGTATKRDPKKWAAAKARAKAKMGGKWSARAAQLAVKYYKDSGGRYKGKKPTAKNNKLKKWTKQDWQWSGDVKKEQKNKKKKKSREKKSELIAAILEKEAGKGVYLPRRAAVALNSTKEGRKKLRSAEANKRRATNRGEQHSTHGLHEGKNRSKLGADLSKEKSDLRDLIRGRKLDTDAEPALDVVKMSYFDDVADPDNVRPIDRQENLRGFSQTASDPQYIRPRTPKTNEAVEDASTNLYNRIGNQDYNQFGEKAVHRLGNLGAYR